jgi:hypothetical protein
MRLKLSDTFFLALILSVGLAAIPACRGAAGAVDDAEDPEVECVDPPSLADLNLLVERACNAEFACRDLPGSDVDPEFLRECKPRRIRALSACLRTESALACLANLEENEDCASLESEPCQRVFECEAR